MSQENSPLAMCVLTMRPSPASSIRPWIPQGLRGFEKFPLIELLDAETKCHGKPRKAHPQGGGAIWAFYDKTSSNQ